MDDGPENKKGIPVGTYKKSCNGCRRVRDTFGRFTLICSHCLKDCGTMRVESSIEMNKCHSKSFSNNDGTLVCDKPVIPKGTYKESCSSCAVHDGILKCKICASGGDIPVVNTQIEVNGCSSIANQNGQLVCDDKAHDSHEL